jgi:phage terminase small subunit
MKQLTQQQKRFVSEYIMTLDGELAAKKSGYKCKDLKTFASTLLMKDYIIHEIKAQLKLQIDSLNVQKGYVIQKLLQIAEFF